LSEADSSRQKAGISKQQADQEKGAGKEGSIFSRRINPLDGLE
jgi:hypothetical protein